MQGLKIGPKIGPQVDQDIKILLANIGKGV